MNEPSVGDPNPNPNPNAMCRVSRSESDGRARLEPFAALRARRFRLCIQSFLTHMTPNARSDHPGHACLNLWHLIRPENHI